jgi:hypothetical protein
VKSCDGEWRRDVLTALGNATTREASTSAQSGTEMNRIFEWVWIRSGDVWGLVKVILSESQVSLIDKTLAPAGLN